MMRFFSKQERNLSSFQDNRKKAISFCSRLYKFNFICIFETQNELSDGIHFPSKLMMFS